MAIVYLGTNPAHTAGELPAKGTKAPGFTLTGKDFNDFSLADFSGKRVVLNIFLSIDTGVCEASTRKFTELVSKLDNTVLVCISKDLPFAFSRFCAAGGFDNVLFGSDFRNDSFTAAYGVLMTDGARAGLMSRAVVVIDETGTVIYTEQVAVIGHEPDYDKAMAALSHS